MNKKLVGLMGFVFAILVCAIPAMVQAMDMPVATEAAVAIPATMIDVQYKACPIMGGETNPAIAAIFEGKVYHFCCEGCVAAFKKDPKSVIAKIVDATEAPLTVTNKDGKCPMTGEAANMDTFLVRGDKITFYCCASCVGKDKLESTEVEETEGKADTKEEKNN